MAGRVSLAFTASFGTSSPSSHPFLPYNRVLFAPVRMVTVPPRHYCIVANPVSRDTQSSVLFDITGQVRLRHADQEIRLAQDPFPLYPGEVLEKVPRFPPLSLNSACSVPSPGLPPTPAFNEKAKPLWEGLRG